jgi:hypothetical protein
MRIRSLNINLLTNFMSAVGMKCSEHCSSLGEAEILTPASFPFKGFSIVLPTLWPFLQRVGGQKEFLGYVVGAFR